MSLISPDDAIAAGLGVGMDEDALQDAIDEEEAWLARRIGQLVGERTERFPLAALRPGGAEIHLARPTDEVEVTQDDTDISTQVEVRGNGWVVAYVPGGGPQGYRFTGFPGVHAVTYTPTDELEVRRALKQLLALTMAPPGGFSSEIMGSYSYSRAGGAATRIRRSIVRSLREPAAAGSTRIRSSVRHGLAGTLGR